MLKNLRSTCWSFYTNFDTLPGLGRGLEQRYPNYISGSACNLCNRNRVPRSNLIEPQQRSAPEEKAPSQIWGYVNSFDFGPRITSACSVTGRCVGGCRSRSGPCWLPSYIHHVFYATFPSHNDRASLTTSKKKSPEDDSICIHFGGLDLPRLCSPSYWTTSAATSTEKKQRNSLSLESRCFCEFPSFQLICVYSPPPCCANMPDNCLRTSAVMTSIFHALDSNEDAPSMLTPALVQTREIPCLSLPYADVRFDGSLVPSSNSSVSSPWCAIYFTPPTNILCDMY